LYKKSFSQVRVASKDARRTIIILL